MNTYQAQGPSSPPIFIGHIKLQLSDENPLYHNIIKFLNPVQIEGIHIVPNNFTPPGFNIEGLTIPDIHMRSFIFHIHAKESNTITQSIIKDFITLTVHGGVQWHPVSIPMNSVYVDSLSFEGDFEVMTLIIHGNIKQKTLNINHINDKSSIAASSIDKILAINPNKNLTVPRTNIQIITNQISKDKIVSMEFKPDYIIRTSLLSLTGIQSKDLEIIEYQKLRFISSKFKESEDDMNKISQVENLNFIKRISYQYQESLISIHQVANLIECIFSYEDKECLLIDDFINKEMILNNIALNLELCWQSNKDNQMKLFPEDKDYVNISIGIEAISILSAILTSSMDALRYDSQSIITTTITDKCSCSSSRDSKQDSDFYKETKSIFQNYAIAVLKCVKAILMNEFTALEFTESGGLSFLCYLLQQQLHAPIGLTLPRSELLACFQLALSYYTTAMNILAPPEDPNDTSCYQTFLYLIKDLKSLNNNCPTITNTNTTGNEAYQLVDILNRCALADSLLNFQMYSYTILNSATDISDALSWHHSKIQTTFNEDINNNINEHSGTTTSGGENEVNRLIRACEIVDEMYPILIQKCTSLHLSIQAVETMINNSNNNNNTNNNFGLEEGVYYDNVSDQISLVMLLSNSKIMSSLVALISLTLIIQELCTATEDDSTIPSANAYITLVDHMKSLAQMCNSLFTQLMSLEYSELLFIRHIDELSICREGIFHQFQYVHDIPLYSRSHIDIIISTCSLSHQEICISLYQKCWFIHLDNYIFALFNQFIQAISDYLSIAPINNNSNESNDSLEMKLLSEILQYCTNPISLESIIKIFCKYFQDLFLNILELLKNKINTTKTNTIITNNNNNDTDIQNMILKLFEYSIYQRPYLKKQSYLRLLSNEFMMIKLQEFYCLYQELHKQNNLVIHKLDITKLQIYFDKLSLYNMNTLIYAPTQIIHYLDHFDIELLTNTTSTILFINHLSQFLPTYDDNKLKLDSIILIWNSLLNFINRLTYILYSLSYQYNITNYQSQLYASSNIRSNNDLIKLNISLDQQQHSTTNTTTNLEIIEIHQIINYTCLDILKSIVEHLKIILFKIVLLTNNNIENDMNTNINEEKLLESIMKIYLLSENILLYAPFSMIQNNKEYILSNIIQIGINIRLNITSIIQSILRITKQASYLSLIIIYGVKYPEYLEPTLLLLTYLIPNKYHQYDLDLLNKYVPTHCPIIFENQDIIFNNISLLDNNNNIETNIINNMIAKTKIIEKCNKINWKEFLFNNISELAYNSMVFIKNNLTSNEQIEMNHNILKADISFEQIISNYFSNDIININDNKIDILYTSLFEKRYNIITLILASIWSTSKSIHNNCVVLLHKSLVLDLELARTISIALVSSLNIRMIKFFRKQHTTTTFTNGTISTTQEYDPLQIEDIERKAICRVLITLQDICDNNLIHALLFVENGLLLSLFLALRSPIVSISIIALQYLSSIYKCLSKIVNIEKKNNTPSTNDDDDDDNNGDEQSREQFINNILLIIEMIAAGLAELLPIALKSFQRLHNYGLIILEQSSLVISILPKPFIHLFLHSLRRVGEGVSLEFIAIKVWSAFDESYESIVENTNLLKTLKKDKSLVTISATKEKKTSNKHTTSINSSNHQQSQGGIQYTEAELYDIINKSYRKFHCATSALQAIVNILLLAYTEGWIGLSAIHKAFRTSHHGDPKKLIVRYQKGYVMWKNMINSIIDDKYLNQNNQEYSLSNLSSTISKKSSSVLFTYSINELIQIELSSSENDQFNARHGVISQNLKLLIDDMLKFSKYALAKEEKYNLIIKENYNKEITNVTEHIINLSKPLLDNNLLFYKRFKYLSERVGFGSSLNYCDIINRDLRYMIENPILSIENKLLLPDKKKLPSIYYNTSNWLLEEFKTIQRLHNEQDAANLIAEQSLTHQGQQIVKKSRFSKYTDIVSHNSNNNLIPMPSFVLPIRPPPPPPSLPPRGMNFPHQYPPTSQFLPSHTTTNNNMMRISPLPYPPRMFPIGMPPPGTNTTTASTTVPGMIYPPPSSMSITVPPHSFNFPRPPRGSSHPRFPFQNNNKKDFNPSTNPSKIGTFNKYSSDDRYGFNDKESFTNKNDNGEDDSISNKNKHDDKYQFFKDSYERASRDSTFHPGTASGTNKEMIQGREFGGRGWYRERSGYREREKEKVFRDKESEVFRDNEDNAGNGYREKERGYQEGRDKVYREKEKSFKERENENITEEEDVRGIRGSGGGYRDSKESGRSTNNETVRSRRRDNRDRVDTRGKYGDSRGNNEKKDIIVKDSNVMKESKINVRDHREVKDSKRGRDSSKDREYRNKTYH